MKYKYKEYPKWILNKDNKKMIVNSNEEELEHGKQEQFTKVNEDIIEGTVQESNDVNRVSGRRRKSK